MSDLTTQAPQGEGGDSAVAPVSDAEAIAYLRQSREAGSGEAQADEEGVNDDENDEADNQSEGGDAETEESEVVEGDEDADVEDEEIIELTDDYSLEVKVNGKMQQVTLADLKDNYSGTSELSRQYDKMRDERTQFEAASKDIEVKRSEYTGKLEDTKAMLEALKGKPPSRNLLEEDPTEYTRQKLMYDERIEAITSLDGEIQKAKDESAQAATLEYNKWADQQASELNRVFPDWSNNNGDNERRKTIFEQALKEGFTADQIRGVHPWPIYVLLDKAAKYDAIKKKNPAQNKRTKRIPKVVKPGASTTRETKQSQQLQGVSEFLRSNRGSKSERQNAAVRLIRETRQRNQKRK